MKYYLLKVGDKDCKVLEEDNNPKYEIFTSNSFGDSYSKISLEKEVERKFNLFIQEKYHFWYIWYGALVFLLLFFVLSIIPDPFVIWDEVVTSVIGGVLFFVYKKKNIEKSRSYIKKKEYYFDNLLNSKVYNDVQMIGLEEYVNEHYRDDLDDIIISSRDFTYSLPIANKLLENLKVEYKAEYKLALKIFKTRDSRKYQKEYLFENSHLVFLFLILLNRQ